MLFLLVRVPHPKILQLFAKIVSKIAAIKLQPQDANRRTIPQCSPRTDTLRPSLSPQSSSFLAVHRTGRRFCGPVGLPVQPGVFREGLRAEMLCLFQGQQVREGPSQREGTQTPPPTFAFASEQKHKLSSSNGLG